jgi:hypothetical protein
VPIAATGFVIAATSGVCLIATNATEYAGNPFLLIKFPAIATGLVNAAVMRQLTGWKAREDRELTRREARQLSIGGAISLTSWLAAIAAGRMIGYW